MLDLFFVSISINFFRFVFFSATGSAGNFCVLSKKNAAESSFSAAFPLSGIICQDSLVYIDSYRARFHSYFCPQSHDRFLSQQQETHKK